MKKHIRLFLCILTAAVFMFASCKSTPKDSGSSSDDGSASTSTTDSSLGLNGSGKDSSQDSSSGSGTGSGQDDASSGKTDDSGYDSLFKEIEKSRKAALDCGADDEVSAFFNALDQEYAKQRKSAQSGGKNDDMTNVLQNINDTYKALAKYKEAKEKKRRIDAKGYASNSQKAYDEGAGIIEELDNIFSDPAAYMATLSSGKSACGGDLLKKATLADNDFINVFKTTATNERTAAFNAKKQADSVKASVSRKGDYDNGVGIFRSGDQNYVTDSIEEAIEDYVSARKIFSRLYTEVLNARKKAQSKLDDAKDKVGRSLSLALNADKSMPLTEKIDGIEDHNKVLLEADDFTASAATYVELEESLNLGAVL